jgi:hypothetical protein
VPKCFKVTRNGGTDGDALDPDFSFEKHGAEFGPWMKESSPAEHIDELVDKVRCVVLCCAAGGSLPRVRFMSKKKGVRMWRE